MQDSMNVEVIHTCPCHKDGHHIRSLFAVVDVIHEVSKAIDDNQTNSFVLAQGVVYDCNTEFWGVLSQAPEHEAWVVLFERQTRESVNTLQDSMAVIFALFGIKIKNGTFAFR